MKKLLTLSLALVLVMSLCAVAFAATATLNNDDLEDVQSVTVTYEETSTAVYNVVVTYGSLQGKYSAGWNPEDHLYNDLTNAAITFATGANKIDVVNHSNRAMTAAFAYADTHAKLDTAATFSANSIDLATADQGASYGDKTNAPAGNVTFELDVTGSTLNRADFADTTIVAGTITVTLTEKVITES